ncbi:TRAP transporter substrate-binding protein [Polynucleobacter sinensis]|uniref:TRAP transporter substrate-binding protein n=1 Tax=Polynucleobacter sinensis TaxID=1743157 RepID=UPI000784BBA7|nr:TRAP transporter substrate-binding protein DctP [Polynucleobacter sinensis]
MNPLQIGANDSVEDLISKTASARKWLDTTGEDLTVKADAITLRVSAHIPGNSPAVKDVFEPAFKRLQIMTKGAIQVEGYWGGSLHKEREGIDALINNVTDMCPVYSAWDAKIFPAAQSLSLPFIFPSAEVATAVSEALYHDYFKKDFESNQILMGRLVATSEYNLFSREPMNCLDDLIGKKIACSDGMEFDIYQTLGAIPVGCSTPEAKKKFANKEVDAVSISDSAAHTAGIFQDARYRTSANLVRVNLEYGLSHHFWNKLSPDLKIIVNQWLRALAQAGAQLFYGLAGARARVAFKEAGMQFIDINQEEIERWNHKLAGVQDQYSNKMKALGYPSDEMIHAIEGSTKHFSQYSADELFENALNHPLTNITPLG